MATMKARPLAEALVGKKIISVRTNEEKIEFTLDTGEVISFDLETGPGGAYISVSRNDQIIDYTD